MQVFSQTFDLANKLAKSIPNDKSVKTLRGIEENLKRRKQGTPERKKLASGDLTPSKLWLIQVIAIMAVQQKSSINGKFEDLAKKNFRYGPSLSHTKSLDLEERTKYFEGKFDTKRLMNKKSKGFAKNIEYFRKNGHGLVNKIKELQRLATSKKITDKQELLDLEREVACQLDILKEVGPKTARNILQMLGLTHYVVPIDSRLSKLAGDFGITIGGLGEEEDYVDTEDQFIQLAESVSICPSELDGYLFFCKELKGALRKIKEMKLTVAQHKQLDRIWKFLESLNID